MKTPAPAEDEGGGAAGRKPWRPRRRRRQRRAADRIQRAAERGTRQSKELARLDQLRKDKAVSPQVAAALLQMAENRRGRTDVMMWQVPALALAAEAFLLSISLAPDTRGLGRTLAAGAGIIVIGASLQLMLRHRYHEILYAEWLAKAETASALPRLHEGPAAEALAWGREGHPWGREPGEKLSAWKKPSYLLRRRLVAEQSSISLWQTSLLILLAIDVAVFVIGVGTMLGWWDPL